MGGLEELIENEFSAGVIGVINLKLDSISELVEGNMEPEVYERMEDKFTDMLVEASKEFFTQGFLRGVAAVKGGAV